MLNKVLSLKIFHTMLRIRMVEERISELYVEQEMRCPVHLCSGQEAIPAGVCANLCKEDYVFGACAGAGIYRREFFKEVGIFDEDFFIFAEDVDINMRGQLQGFKCVYLPEAKVYHIGTATVGLYSDRSANR